MEEAFNNRLLDLVSTKNQNSQILTKLGYINMIKKVKAAKSKKNFKSPGEYQRLRRYDVLKMGNEEKLILPVKEDGSVIYYVHTDEIFEILNSVHLALEHGGRSRMKREINKMYKNITQEMVMIYLSLCEFCQMRQNAGKKESGKALLHNNSNSCKGDDDTCLDKSNLNQWYEDVEMNSQNDSRKRSKRIMQITNDENEAYKDLANGSISASRETGFGSREIDWNEKLIATVQNKPGLYEKNHPDRETVNLLWLEVFEAMIPHWNELSVHEKLVRGREMKDRWRNLRTCFRRELNKQRLVFYDTDRKMRKRRKYVYYDQLMFLRPAMEDGETNSETDSNRIKEEEVWETDSGRIKEEEVSETEAEILNENLSNYSFPIKSPPQKISNELTGTERDPLKLEEVDEDKTFLLSLLPSFRRMEEEEKLEARMEFLWVIKGILKRRKNSEKFVDATKR